MISFGIEYVLLVIDVNNFKLLSDSYGNLFGDQVLILLARAIESMTDSSNVISRIGGDEFGVLLPKSSVNAGKSFAKKLSSCFTEKINTRRALIKKLTLSIGIEQYCNGDNDIKSVMLRVDEALYLAKQNDQNCIMSSPNQCSKSVIEWR